MTTERATVSRVCEMNPFEPASRSWRKAPRRGVSPIIATILLVAMGVVLAALLYVLVSGLAHGPGSTTLGAAFAAGHPTGSTCSAGSSQAIGSTPIMGGCKAGDFIYTLTVESSTVTFGSVLFEVKTASGLVFGGGGGTSSFAVLDISSHVAAISVTGSSEAMAASWQGYGLTSSAPVYSGTTSLSNTFTIVIDQGSATPTLGQGLMF